MTHLQAVMNALLMHFDEVQLLLHGLLQSSQARPRSIECHDSPISHSLKHRPRTTAAQAAHLTPASKPPHLRGLHPTEVRLQSHERVPVAPDVSVPLAQRGGVSCKVLRPLLLPPQTHTHTHIQVSTVLAVHSAAKGRFNNAAMCQY